MAMNATKKMPHRITRQDIVNVIINQYFVFIQEH